MSFHFLNGNIYSGYNDIGPGTITVDPFADIITGAADTGLDLTSGPWTINLDGGIFSTQAGISLTGNGAFVSNINIGCRFRKFHPLEI